MYIPEYFKQEDPEIVGNLIRDNGFATLISCVDNKPNVTHIPLELATTGDGSMRLEGHVARRNPIWKTFQPDREVLAIFTGPHTYISAGWYDHVNVPTWNYMVTHIYGKPRILDEPGEVFKILKKLVDKYESASMGTPYRVESLPEHLVNSEMQAIVAFHIHVDRIETSFKLSQNHSAANHKSIVDQLRKRGDEASIQIANAMEEARERSKKARKSER